MVANSELRGDESVVATLIANRLCNFKNASNRLRSDKGFILLERLQKQQVEFDGGGGGCCGGGCGPGHLALVVDKACTGPCGGQCKRAVYCPGDQYKSLGRLGRRLLNELITLFVAGSALSEHEYHRLDVHRAQ